MSIETVLNVSEATQNTMCTGLHITVKQLLPYDIEATNKMESSFIPIILTGLPCVFKQPQLPVKLSFAMTINKRQG